MLQQLHIENFAIIDSLDLELFKGMTVVTGETGAGKSIIMDALGMVLGDRADAAVVPPHATKAIIIASFSLTASSPVLKWLKEHDLDADGSECLLKRTINKEGRSKAFINGQPSTLALLKELAEQLVDIHGQHAHHALLKAAHQLSLLDQYANHPLLLSKVAFEFQKLQQLQHSYDKLLSAKQQRADRKTLLQYQLQELDSFGLTEEETNLLDDEHHRLANAQQLQQSALSSAEQLSDSETAESITDLLNITLKELEAFTQKDKKLNQIFTQLQSAAIEIEEASRELRDYGESLELNPERLQTVEERLATWHDLARKHSLEPNLLLEHHQRLDQEFIRLGADEDELTEISEQLERSKNSYSKEALQLTKSREKAATKLEQAVASQLKILGMAGSKLKVEFISHSENPGKDGLEKINLLIQPNPGLPAQPLNKIASGGELSRISLAIQVVTVSQQSIPLMVFDEVDVGIGGGTAEVVGQLLKSLAVSAQVLCITHQPQVASQGAQHLRVEKTVTNGKTSTGLVLLSQEQKIEEISRMLGGLDITETTRKHAREMLQV